jgi:hypothetical protein
MNEDLFRLLGNEGLSDELSEKIATRLMIEFTPNQLRHMDGEAKIQFHTILYTFIKNEIGEYASGSLNKENRHLGICAARHAALIPSLVEELAWFNRVCRLYKGVHRKESLPIFEMLVPVLKDKLQTYQQEFIYFLQRYVNVLDQLKQHREMVESLNLIYDYEINVAGEWHPDSMATLQRIIDSNRLAGLYGDERAAIERQMDVMMHVFARTDWEKLLDVIKAKAETFAHEQEYEQSSGVYIEWLLLYENKFGKDHKLTCQLLMRAADTFYRFDEQELADEFYERAVHVCKRRIHQVPAQDSFAFIRRIEEMYMLADVYRTHGEDELALHVYFEITAKCEEHFGVKHYETLRANHELVCHMEQTKNENYHSVLQLMQEYMDVNSKPYGYFFTEVHKRLLDYYRTNCADQLLFETYRSMIVAGVEQSAWYGRRVDWDTLSVFVRDTIHKQRHQESIQFLRETEQYARRLKIDPHEIADLMFHELRIYILNKPMRVRLLLIKINRVFKVYIQDPTRNHEMLQILFKWRQQYSQ